MVPAISKTAASDTRALAVSNYSTVEKITTTALTIVPGIKENLGYGIVSLKASVAVAEIRKGDKR